MKYKPLLLDHHSKGHTSYQIDTRETQLRSQTHNYSHCFISCNKGKVSSKSISCCWEYPFAMRLALFSLILPSTLPFFFKTHLIHMTLLSSGESTNSNVKILLIAYISSTIAFFHSLFCRFFKTTRI